MQKIYLPTDAYVADEVWSLGSCQIVFQQQSVIQNERYLVKADGSNLHRLVDSKAVSLWLPKRSPNGS